MANLKHVKHFGYDESKQVEGGLYTQEISFASNGIKLRNTSILIGERGGSGMHEWHLTSSPHNILSGSPARETLPHEKIFDDGSNAQHKQMKAGLHIRDVSDGLTLTTLNVLSNTITSVSNDDIRNPLLLLFNFRAFLTLLKENS